MIIDGKNNLAPSDYQITYCFQREYLLNGELKDWSGEFQPVYSPICSNGICPEQLEIGKYPLLDEGASNEILASSVAAYGNGYGKWPSMSPARRIKYMRNFVKELKKSRSEVVNFLMWEIGKSLQDSEKEFDRTIEYINKTIEYYHRKTKVYRVPRSKKEILGFVSLQPRGVALCMGPYNYPLNETFTTLIPALITGNVVIFKPPRLGVLLHRPILRIMSEVFPPGVVNTIYGEGQKVIAPLMSSGKIDVLAFIGSSRVADLLRKMHPQPHRLHSVLGLEAKNPAVVMKDCNLENTIKEAIAGALSYNGQRCTALKIIFVEREIAEQFCQKFSDRVSNLKLGLPWEVGVNITPLPEFSKTEYLHSLIEDAKQHGAEVINAHGGENTITYFKPAILYPVNMKMKVYYEEQFGPVVPIVPFDNADEVVEYISNSHFGQQVSIFSEKEERIKEFLKKLGNQVARININSQCQRSPDTMPFTGRKDSAEGVLSVSEAIKEFTLPLVIATINNRNNKKLIKF